MFGRLRGNRENGKWKGVGEGHVSNDNGSNGDAPRGAGSGNDNMRSPSFDENPERSLPTYGRSSSRKHDSASFGRVLSYFKPTAVKGSSDQHGIVMRLRRFFGAVTGRVEGNVASRKARWLYGLACGRRRTDWYAALVFLVPCSVCFTVFMWPYVLPSDLIEAVYRSTATSASACTAMTTTYVAPIVAQQYEMNRAKCLDQGGCPSAEDMGSLICQQTEACGADPAQAAKNLENMINLAAANGGALGRRRTLLQFEGLIDFVADNGADSFPKDAVDVDDTLSEAASPCAGCKKLATQVFKEAEKGAPDKRWVEAMIRVHGREWCVRQSESVLPAYDPWKTYRGITSWAQVGNTPADENYMKANGIPKFGGAGAMKSKNTDKNTSWPPQDALRNGEYNPFVANATGNRNGTFDNSTFVDPPVNEALMKLLLENSPQLACPLSKADKVKKVEALLRGETWPPPVRPPPPWAKHCVKNATRDVIGHVGHTSIHSRASLEFTILVPAMIMFSVMIINSAAMLYWVETPIVFGGIVVLALVLADNWLAVRNMIHCMDRVFLALNILHMSIIAGAMLSAVGLLGHRTLMGGTLWDAERTRWREWMASKMLKGPKNAQFNVKRANVIVQGTANMLVSSAARKLIPGLNVAAGAGKKAGGMVLKGVKKGARFARPSRNGILGSWMGKTGFPRFMEDSVENLWRTKVLGKPPKPAKKRLTSFQDNSQLEMATSASAVASEVNKQQLGNLGQVNKRDVDVLMATWRETVQRIMQARTSAKLIELKDDGGVGWQESAIPQHKIGFSGRLRMGIFGTLFVAIVCSLIAAQQVRRFIELLRWSSVARWCTWAAIGIKDFRLIDQIATAICVFLPIGSFAVIVGQLIAISETYRSNIRGLRRGEPVFTKKQMEASEISVGSEWLGYQLVTAGITYFIVIIVLGFMCFGLAIPIIALLNVDPELQTEVLTTMTYIGVVWVSGIMVGVIYRMAHVKLFTEPRLNVLRYVHWFQFSDYLMLYITMQRSFVVVVTRILMSVVVQAACVMRSDMTFFPLMLGKKIDKPHMAYISVVLNDWKYSCPIVWSFYSTALAAGRENGKLRREVEQNLRLKYSKELPPPNTSSEPPSEKSMKSGIKSGMKGVAKGMTDVAKVTSGGLTYLLFGGKDDMSNEMREELEVELDKIRRSRRARTRWFLALTLMNNPSLIAMRRPWGGQPQNVAMLKPSHLPHAVKKGWLRRRGGILGVVNDDYVMLTPGVLYIFEHDLARNPKVYTLSSRVLVRRLFVSVRDQTSGGWHFGGDRYEPGPDEVDPPDAEDGLRLPSKKIDDKEKGNKKKDDKDKGGDGDPAKSAESSKWKLREKHFFVISIPGGPMEVFASADLDDVTDWVGALRASCLGAPDRSMLAGLKQD